MQSGVHTPTSLCSGMVLRYVNRQTDHDFARHRGWDLYRPCAFPRVAAVQTGKVCIIDSVAAGLVGFDADRKTEEQIDQGLTIYQPAWCDRSHAHQIGSNSWSKP